MIHTLSDYDSAFELDTSHIQLISSFPLSQIVIDLELASKRSPQFFDSICGTINVHHAPRMIASQDDTLP